MQAFLLKDGGELVELEAGTRVIFDLAQDKTIEFVVDNQDFKAATMLLEIKTGGKPVAKLINATTLQIGLKTDELKQAVDASPH